MDYIFGDRTSLTFAAYVGGEPVKVSRSAVQKQMGEAQVPVGATMITPVDLFTRTEAQRIEPLTPEDHCTGAYGDVVVVE